MQEIYAFCEIQALFVYFLNVGIVRDRVCGLHNYNGYLIG